MFYSLVLIISFWQTAVYANAETFYIESWKKGGTQIKEKTLTLNLNEKTANYIEWVFDSAEKKKYKLYITAGKGSKGIIEWMVEFKEVSNKEDDNLLKLLNDKDQDSFNWQDFFGWFYKGSKEQFEKNNQFKIRNSVLPFLSKRIVKIENFYCILQIIDYAQNKHEEVILDSVTMQIQFTNKCDLAGCALKNEIEETQKAQIDLVEI